MPGRAKPAGATITVLTLKHARAAEMAEVLTKVFAPQGVEVTPDPRTNQLIVRSDADAVPAVTRVVEQLDVQVPEGA
jgi:type II secretory pathway component GspD/PulD (secretin)